jgi:flagellar motor switch/type III secretory pathway protein FliN
MIRSPARVFSPRRVSADELTYGNLISACRAPVSFRWLGASWRLSLSSASPKHAPLRGAGFSIEADWGGARVILRTERAWFDQVARPLLDDSVDLDGPGSALHFDELPELVREAILEAAFADVSGQIEGATRKRFRIVGSENIVFSGLPGLPGLSNDAAPPAVSAVSASSAVSAATATPTLPAAPRMPPAQSPPELAQPVVSAWPAPAQGAPAVSGVSSPAPKQAGAQRFGLSAWDGNDIYSVSVPDEELVGEGPADEHAPEDELAAGAPAHEETGRDESRHDETEADETAGREVEDEESTVGESAQGETTADDIAAGAIAHREVFDDITTGHKAFANEMTGDRSTGDETIEDETAGNATAGYGTTDNGIAGNAAADSETTGYETTGYVTTDDETTEDETTDDETTDDRTSGYEATGGRRNDYETVVDMQAPVLPVPPGMKRYFLECESAGRRMGGELLIDAQAFGYLANALRTMPPAARNRREWANLPVSLRFGVGWVDLPSRTLAGVGPRDVLLLDETWLMPGALSDPPAPQDAGRSRPPPAASAASARNEYRGETAGLAPARRGRPDGGAPRNGKHGFDLRSLPGDEDEDEDKDQDEDEDDRDHDDTDDFDDFDDFARLSGDIGARFDALGRRGGDGFGRPDRSGRHGDDSRGGNNGGNDAGGGDDGRSEGRSAGRNEGKGYDAPGRRVRRDGAGKETGTAAGAGSLSGAAVPGQADGDRGDNLFDDACCLTVLVGKTSAFRAAISNGKVTVMGTLGEIMADTAAAEEYDDGRTLDDVTIRLTFDLGERVVSVGELRTLAPGFTFDLGRQLRRAVTIRANGMAVGEGELVEIDGRIGVSVLSLNRFAE